MYAHFKYPVGVEVNDTAENRLLHNTFFIVEATSFERHELWAGVARESRRRCHADRPGVLWEQSNGWLVTVGHLDNRPVCISVQWDRVEGQWLMFYEATSQVVDHKMIDEWLAKHFTGKWDNKTRAAKTDASNFHNCLIAIEQRNNFLRVKRENVKICNITDKWYIECIVSDKMSLLLTRWGTWESTGTAGMFDSETEAREALEKSLTEK